MKPGTLKIIDCFNLSGLGLLAEVQHQENGIPPNTLTYNAQTGERWFVKKRVYTGLLLVAKEEVFFDCETGFEHISHSFRTPEAREQAVERERERRTQGIYWYVLAPETKKQRAKPEVGTVLEIRP